MTRFIADTHLLLWAASAPDKLSRPAREALEDPAMQPVFSVVSLWEIVIKAGLGRADFRADARLLRRGLLENGYEELVVSAPHVLGVASLPAIHADPFDRLLLAQAAAEGMVLMSADRRLGGYPVPVWLV